MQNLIDPIIIDLIKNNVGYIFWSICIGLIPYLFYFILIKDGWTLGPDATEQKRLNKKP